MGEGWMRGFEPPTFGTTIRRSNQLSYIHRAKEKVYDAGPNRSTAVRSAQTYLSVSARVLLW